MNRAIFHLADMARQTVTERWIDPATAWRLTAARAANTQFATDRRMGTMVLVPLVARAVAPVPVIAAGGLADGAGLAAALMLGAQGALLGTRSLATTEASIPEAYKQVLVDSDGHNTVVTELPDVANATVWPGAYARIERNHFYETSAGREGELRYRHAEAAASASQALETGDTDNAFLYTGQTAGLIDTIEPAGVIVDRIVADATERLSGTPFTS